MIRKQKQTYYFVGETPYASLEEAKKADIRALMPPDTVLSNGECVTDWMLRNSAAIVDTLTTSPKSRLSSRKLHGATRKPRSRKQTKPADPNKPF